MALLMTHRGPQISPFPPGYRASGVLLHVTSLPSAYGIGDIGPGALRWVDRLHEAGQSWWQMLPLGPTGHGDSPYQCLSSFAGNEVLVSPDWLIEDELLTPADCAGDPFSARIVEYEKVVPFKLRLLRAAWENFDRGARSDLRPSYEAFCQSNESWLSDYALFRALKNRYNGVHYRDWPVALVKRKADALAGARRELKTQIDAIRFAQFQLSRQVGRLRQHAGARGLYLIGDLPFFVSSDSSDVWAHPEFFLLDSECRSSFVAGVPPDYFSTEGQLWGNPVYDWEALAESRYRWWLDRLRALLTHFDVIRLDHFRAFAAAWHVPVGSSTAKVGQWAPGPGVAFFDVAASELGNLPFIAEDLGLITPDVTALRDHFRLTGMRVLQFAFDGNKDNPYLPANYVPNTVVYTGTHDNATTRGWYEELSASRRRDFWKCLDCEVGASSVVAPALMQLAWDSMAALAIAPLQDVLNLGNEARMNRPGRPEGNWRWRCTEEMLAGRDFEWLLDLTNGSGRSRGAFS